MHRAALEKGVLGTGYGYTIVRVQLGCWGRASQLCLQTPAAAVCAGSYVPAPVLSPFCQGCMALHSRHSACGSTWSGARELDSPCDTPSAAPPRRLGKVVLDRLLADLEAPRANSKKKGGCDACAL